MCKREAGEKVVVIRVKGEIQMYKSILVGWDVARMIDVHASQLFADMKLHPLLLPYLLALPRFHLPQAKPEIRK